MTSYTDKYNGTENFRCSDVSSFPSVEIVKVLHPLLHDIVYLQVEEGEQEHREDVEQGHGLDHVGSDIDP